MPKVRKTISKNSRSQLNKKAQLSTAIAMALALPTAHAAIFNVTEAQDDGTGLTANTLSWAILQANTTAGDDVIELNTDVTITGVMKRLIDSNTTLESDATRRTIDGNNQFRPLFIKSGQVTIQNLDIENGLAEGGNSNSGGAGAGMGGGLFVYDGAVLLNNLSIKNSSAIGGSNSGGFFARGGGGIFGQSHSGGGGLFESAQSSSGGYGGYGNYQAQDLQFGKGGDHGGTFDPSDSGGFGAGGGYGYYGTAGDGGFGGGGGFGYYVNGGDGGFGAGAGISAYYSYGTPGFGGSYQNAAGLGGAVFVRGGALTIQNSLFQNNQALQTGLVSSQSEGLGGAIFVLHTTQNTNSNNQGMPSVLSDVSGCGVFFSNNQADTDLNQTNNNDDVFDSGNRIVPDSGTSLNEACGTQGQEIEISGNNIEISNGDLTPQSNDGTDFGDVTAALNVAEQSFSISNTGTQAIQLSGTPTVELIDANNQFEISVQPSTPVIFNGQSVDFQVRFAPETVGTHTTTVRISNNDIDENPYEFLIRGNGLPTESDIRLSGNNIEILDGDTTPDLSDDTDFGTPSLGIGSVTKTYTIENLGNTVLALTDDPIVEIINNSGQFVVSTQPSSNLVDPGNLVTFDVTFAPNNVGIDTATISIASDDPDENPFDFAVQAEVIAAQPDIALFGNNSIADGDATPSISEGTDFGPTQESGQSVTLRYFIDNFGAGDLLLNGNPTIELQNNSGQFEVTTAPQSTVIQENEFAFFDVTFTPTSLGLDSTTVVIQNNDPDEAPFDFLIQGEGVPQAPVLQVLGRGFEIQNGDQSPALFDDTWFGYTPVNGGQVDHYFELRNSGFADLNLSTVALNQTGNHFSIIQNISDNKLSPGDSTFFGVRFDPEYPSFNVFTAIEVYDNQSNLLHFNTIEGFGQSTLTINSANNYLQEGDVAEFIVSRDVITPYDTPVNWTVGGGQVDANDFGGTLPSGTVNIPPNVNQAVIQVPTLQDGIYEGPELFNIRLNTPDLRLNLGFPSVSGGVIDDDLIYLDGFDVLNLNQVIAGITKYAFDAEDLPACDRYACNFLNRSMAIENNSIEQGLDALIWFEETLMLMQPNGDWDGDGLPNQHDLNPFGLGMHLLIKN